MEKWIGSDKQQLIAAWGHALKTIEDSANGEMLVYASAVRVPQIYGNTMVTNTNEWDYKIFFFNKAGKVYKWKLRRRPIPPAQLDIKFLKTWY